MWMHVDASSEFGEFGELAGAADGDRLLFPSPPPHARPPAPLAFLHTKQHGRLAGRQSHREGLRTCPREAAATGSGVIPLYTSCSGRPSSS